MLEEPIMVDSSIGLVADELPLLEKCEFCGFEHRDLSHTFFKRNHVANYMRPYCTLCNRRLYKVSYKPKRII